MGTPYLGELRIFTFDFPPKGWALCNGQLLPINQNTALFSLLGTTYGGNGTTNFSLPNLQGRVPMDFGNGMVQGASGGEETHTLVLSEYTHDHLVTGQAGPRTSTTSAGGVLASGDIYGIGPSTGFLGPLAVGTSGGNNPHENRQPFLVLNFCIALQGIFPSRS